MKKILLIVLCLPLLQACTKKIEQPSVTETNAIPPDPLIWPCWNNIWHDRGEVDIYFDAHADRAIGFENKGIFLKQTSGTYRVYEYNISNGAWTAKGLFPGLSRMDGTIVVVGTKIYFGLGIRFESATVIYMNDWWEYDPATDQWTPKANFPAAARIRTTAFAASSKAYVVGGYDWAADNYLKQNWQYDPASNAWEQKANFPGAGRYEAAGFSIGSKGYVGTGQGRIMVLNNPVTFYYKDFYEYNAANNSWTQKADYPSAVRHGAFAFMIRGNGFIGGGYNASAGYRELYMYNQLTNSWIEKTDYPGFGDAPHHFGNLFHFSTLDHGYVLQESNWDRYGPVPQKMWRYVKRQNCPNF